MKWVGIAGTALLLALAPAAANAQSTNCSTTDWGAGFTNRYQTSCYTSPDYTSALLGAYVLEAQREAQAQLLAEQQQALQEQQAIQLHNALLSAWATKSIYPGGFVKGADQLAIYRLGDDGLLHAFSTWGAFLNAGGHQDLSNVAVFSTLSALPAYFYGNPI